VPTYRRADLLDRCLSALTSQEFDPRAYEIIIADDAASQDTERQVCDWAARAGDVGRTIRYVPNRGPNHGPAAARNAGWRQAQGNILAFTDDDTLPDRCWLAYGIGAFADGVDGVMGRTSVPLPEDPTDYELNAAGLEGSEFLTANCFYRRDLIAEVGGFEESYTLAWREDTDMWLTLIERGCNLVVAPEAVVVHPIRPAEWGISLKQQKRSQFNALLYKRHPEQYIKRVQPGPIWRYYFMVGALFMTVYALLTGRKLLAFDAAAAWFLMTGRFCAQRLRHTSHKPAHVAEMAVTSALIPPLSVFWRIYGAIKFRVPFL
jgi:cellulose synthase/poly-beta-1,6-N-acetylglucosamine synthase-like glycosyltransferase